MKFEAGESLESDDDSLLPEGERHEEQGPSSDDQQSVPKTISPFFLSYQFRVSVSQDGAALIHWGDSSTNEGRSILHFPFDKSSCYHGFEQIFFASRTHSQLTQVMRELLQLRSVYSASENPANEHDGHNDLKGSRSPLPRSVSLASRSHLCINEQLRAKTTDLDEGCRELLTSGCCSKIQN